MYHGALTSFRSASGVSSCVPLRVANVSRSPASVSVPCGGTPIFLLVTRAFELKVVSSPDAEDGEPALSSKSDSPGRGTVVAKGSSVRPRQPQDVLADVCQDQVVRDGRDLEEPRLA